MVKIVFFNDVPKSRHISCVLEIFCSKLYSKFVFDGHHVHKAAQLLKKIPSESKYLALIQLGIPAPSFANCFPSSRPVSLVHSQNFFYIGPYRRRSFAPLIYPLTFGLSSFFLWQTNIKKTGLENYQLVEYKQVYQFCLSKQFMSNAFYSSKYQKVKLQNSLCLYDLIDDVVLPL